MSRSFAAVLAFASGVHDATAIKAATTSAVADSSSAQMVDNPPQELESSSAQTDELDKLIQNLLTTTKELSGGTFKGDITGKDNTSRTLLHWVFMNDACEPEDAPAIVEELVKKHGLKVNAKNANKETPLHMAACMDPPNVEAMSVLLKYGADPYALNADQETALAAAKEYGQQESADFLEKYCKNNPQGSIKTKPFKSSAGTSEGYSSWKKTHGQSDEAWGTTKYKMQGGQMKKVHTGKNIFGKKRS